MAAQLTTLRSSQPIPIPSAFTAAERQTETARKVSAATGSGILITEQTAHDRDIALSMQHDDSRAQTNPRTAHDAQIAASLHHTETSAHVLGDQKNDRRELERSERQRLVPTRTSHNQGEPYCEAVCGTCKPVRESDLSDDEYVLAKATKLRMCKITTIVFIIFFALAWKNIIPHQRADFCDSESQYKFGAGGGYLIVTTGILVLLGLGQSCTNGGG